MARKTVQPPRSLRDAHTLLAQKYAGALVGHAYRGQQWHTTVEVDRAKPWKEPSVVADGCIFCERLTDEEAVRRVAGFQYQIDIECLRSKRVVFSVWVIADEGVPEPNVFTGWANLRRFCELFQDDADWDNTRPFPLVKLALRLKRKLCIEWNHLYLEWMDENDIQYDFEKQFFSTESDYQVDLSELSWPEDYMDYVGYMG